MSDERKTLKFETLFHIISHSFYKYLTASGAISIGIPLNI